MDRQLTVDSEASFAPDPESMRRVRRMGIVTLLVLVASMVAILVDGAEYLRVIGWVFIPLLFGVMNAIRLIRHPERVPRLSPNLSEAIVKEGGLRMLSAPTSASPTGMRLALVDALDVLQREEGSRGRAFLGRMAPRLGAVGWLGASVFAFEASGDVAAVGFCLVFAALFGLLDWYNSRRATERARAIELLSTQLDEPDLNPEQREG